MGLLDGGLSSVFAKAFAAIYLPATLYVRTVTDNEGSMVEGEPLEYGCRAQIDDTTESMRQQSGYADSDRRILVLTDTLAVKPTTDDQIEVGGQRYNIASISADPANSHWVMRGSRG